MIVPRAPYRSVEDPPAIPPGSSPLLESKWQTDTELRNARYRKQTHPLPQPYILFDSNFNGGTDEYLEGFSLVVPWAMRATWGLGYGVPDMAKVSAFQRYVHSATVEPSYYYCGYPSSTRMIQSAIALQLQLCGFARQGGTDLAFPSLDQWNCLLTKVQTLRQPEIPRGTHRSGRFFAFAPVIPGRAQELKRRLAELRDASLVPRDRTHFARWVVFDRLLHRHEDEYIDEEFLLFCAWFDGTELDYLMSLYRCLGAKRVWRIWELCHIPGNDREGVLWPDFCAYMKSHRLAMKKKESTEFPGYLKWSVPEIRTALALASDFKGLMVGLDGASEDKVQSEWRRFAEDHTAQLR